MKPRGPHTRARAPFASQSERLNDAANPSGPGSVVAHTPGARHADATPVLVSSSHKYLSGDPSPPQQRGAGQGAPRKPNTGVRSNDVCARVVLWVGRYEIDDLLQREAAEEGVHAVRDCGRGNDSHWIHDGDHARDRSHAHSHDIDVLQYGSASAVGDWHPW